MRFDDRPGVSLLCRAIRLPGLVYKQEQFGEIQAVNKPTNYSGIDTLMSGKIVSEQIQMRTFARRPSKSSVFSIYLRKYLENVALKNGPDSSSNVTLSKYRFSFIA
jgi:hypothetical protein